MMCHSVANYLRRGLMSLLIYMEWIVVEGETYILEMSHSEMTGSDVSYLIPKYHPYVLTLNDASEYLELPPKRINAFFLMYMGWIVVGGETWILETWDGGTKVSYLNPQWNPSIIWCVFVVGGAYSWDKP